MKIQIQNLLAALMFVVGGLGMVGLLFFYGVILFSPEWTFLTKTHEALRLLFNLQTGLLVMYASFTALCIPFFLLMLFGVQLYNRRTYITKTQLILLLCVWFLAVLLGFFTTILQVQKIVDRLSPFNSEPAPIDISSGIPLSTQYVFKTTLKNEVVRTQGVPIEGYTPEMFLHAFPGLTTSDFEGVEASIGHYTLENGKLVHKLDQGRLIHSAAGAVTDRGLDVLLTNVSVRLGIDLTTGGTLTQIMEVLVSPVSSEGVDGEDVGELPSTPPSGGGPVACTMEAKICPDGSAVGRTAPSCAFAPCPSTQTAHTCTPAERDLFCTKEYRPVCGLVSVQCVTTPCNPVSETFGNGCTACSNDRVVSYTGGACTP